MRERNVLKAIADINERGGVATSFAIYEALDKQRRFRLRGRLEWFDAMFLSPSITSMWVILTRSEERGLVTSDWIEGPKPRKRAYWLTYFGQQICDGHNAH